MCEDDKETPPSRENQSTTLTNNSTSKIQVKLSKPRRIINLISLNKNFSYESFLNTIESGNLKELKRFKPLKKYLMAVSFDQCMPLYVAISKGYQPIVEYFLKNKINIFQLDKFSMYKSLHLAALLKRHEIIKMLINSDKVKVDEQDNYGRTPLHIAAMLGDSITLQLLFEKNNNAIEIKDSRGNTPFHLAADNGHEEIVGWLLMKAYRYALNNKEETPLDKAIKGQHDQVIKLLQGDYSLKTTSPGTSCQAPLASAMNQINDKNKENILFPPAPPSLSPEESLDLENQFLKQKIQAMKAKYQKKEQLFQEKEAEFSGDNESLRAKLKRYSAMLDSLDNNLSLNEKAKDKVEDDVESDNGVSELASPKEEGCSMGGKNKLVESHFSSGLVLFGAAPHKENNKEKSSDVSLRPSSKIMAMN